MYIYTEQNQALLACWRCDSVIECSRHVTKPRPTVPSFQDKVHNVRGVLQDSTGHVAIVPPVTFGVLAFGFSAGPRLSVRSIPRQRSRTWRIFLFDICLDKSSPLFLCCKACHCLCCHHCFCRTERITTNSLAVTGSWASQNHFSQLLLVGI